MDGRVVKRVLGTSKSILHGLRTTPAQVEAASLEWGLDTVSFLSASSRSEIFVCRRTDGTTVVVKFFADAAQLEQESSALRAWQDVAVVVDQLGTLPTVGAMMLPYLAAPNHRRAVSADLIHVLRDLTTVKVPIVGFPPLVERVRQAFNATRARLTNRTGEKLTGFDEALVESQDRAIRLALEPGVYGLVHADLHFANVLITSVFGHSAPVAIDPMPHVGDRTFDAIDVALEGVTSREQLEKQIRRLESDVPQLDSARLLAWCLACGPVIGLRTIRQRPHDQAARFQVTLAFERL